MQLRSVTLRAILTFSFVCNGAPIRGHKFIVRSGERNIEIESRCALPAPQNAAAIIFLHGSGGPDSKNLPYLDEERILAKQGYCIYVPHYLDSTGGLTDNPQRRYSVWVQAVKDTAKYIADNTGTPRNRIALVGYSLGASVALAAAARTPTFGAIIEFSGSLPDEYFSLLNALPPLLIIHGQSDSVIPVENAIRLGRLCATKGLSCAVQLYAGEGHVFSMAGVSKSKLEVERFLKERLPVN